MNLTRVLSSTAALVTLLAIESHASAQAAPPEAAPPPPPPVASTQPAPPPGAVIATAAPWQPPPAYYAPGEAPPPEGKARFRFGFDVGGGYAIAGSSVGPAHGPVFNLGGRFGIQLNNPWAVYLQSSLLVGSMSRLINDSKILGGPALSWSHGIIAEYTLANTLHFGLGPSLALMDSSVCAANTKLSTLSCADATGPAVDITGRIAATFGMSRPNRRHAFSLGLDLHPTFTSSSMFLFFMALSAGYEAF